MSHIDQLQVLLRPCNQSRYRQEADRRDPTPSSEVDLQFDKVFSNIALSLPPPFLSSFVRYLYATACDVEPLGFGRIGGPCGADVMAFGQGSQVFVALAEALCGLAIRDAGP
jgi:hypothetical protein